MSVIAQTECPAVVKLGSMAEHVNDKDLRLDHTLEAALKAHWNELMPETDAGLIQVEYRTEKDGNLQYLKIWASTDRSGWNLICEQWVTAAWSQVPGLQFSPGYYSKGLGRVLEVISRNQNAFTTPADSEQNGRLQVSAPAEEERRTAENCVAEVLASLGSSPTEQLVTAWTGSKARATVGSKDPTAAG